MKKAIYIILITFNIILLILLSLQDLNLQNKVCAGQKKLTTLSSINQNCNKQKSFNYTKDIEDFIKDNKVYIKDLETIPSRKIVSIEIGTNGNLDDIDKLLKQIKLKPSFENFTKIVIKKSDENILNADISIEFAESR
ncbi:hypothetical protein [Clostridium sp. JN-1]|jgi:hypothetical protein|uniref:hypothetical protein n=1 Tax=Clostridium sp. JN-1 TaxID=2483110 RepID=UPI000F0BD052|nr:hypothetical protein [Clostridium sp. JN-1]